MATIHNCNHNPLWYHKLIRPLIRYKITYNISGDLYGANIAHQATYYPKRRWYRWLWYVIDYFKGLK